MEFRHTREALSGNDVLSVLSTLEIIHVGTDRVLRAAAYFSPNNTRNLIVSPESLSVSLSAKSIYSSLQQFKLEDYSLVHTI